MKHLRSLASQPQSQNEIRFSGAQRYLIARRLALQGQFTSELWAGYRA